MKRERVVSGWGAFLGAAVVCVLGSASEAARNDRGGNPRLMQGPMIGPVSESEIVVWGRVSGPYPFNVEYGRAPDLSDGEMSEAVEARAEDDYTVALRLQGLEPETTYYYRPLVRGTGVAGLSRKRPFAVKTAPAAGKGARFTVAYGSCAEWTEDRVQPIWKHVLEAEPDLFFWIGDNIYGDTVHPQFLAEEYRRQREVYELQRLLWTVPQLAIWDDHDFGLNDHDRTNPIKEPALEVFRHYWPNPGYGLPEAPGVYFSYSYGGIDFFFLDCRYYRDPNVDPDRPGKTMLGKKQLAWLMQELKASQAPFKVLISGSGWNSQKLYTNRDSWSAFLHERDLLFDYIRDEAIGGVVLLSGDEHIAHVMAAPWSERGGYDFYEFVSSPLAQETDNYVRYLVPEKYIREPWGGSPNFGLLTFDARGEDATLTFDLINVYGNRVYPTLQLSASELVNGVKTWPQKMDRGEAEIQEMLEEMYRKSGVLD